MGETWNKKDREQKRRHAKKQKQEKKLARKENAGKAKSLDEMLAYVDENGNLSTTPPSRKPSSTMFIPPVVNNSNALNPKNHLRIGVISFFDVSKGYGFITDSQSTERIFVHANSSSVVLKENLKVSFEIERGQKGFAAVNVNIAP